MKQIYYYPCSRRLLVTLLFKFILILCFVNSSQAQTAPTITSFSPTSGRVGTQIVITGSNFNNANLIHFGDGTVTNFTIMSNSEIRAKVPATASSGKIQVRSSSGTGISSSDFTFLEKPIITSFSPTSGRVGEIVTLTGKNLIGTSQVDIGDGSVKLLTVSDKQIQVEVTQWASSGIIEVHNSEGVGYSTENFTVISAPSITSFSPSSGPIGTVIKITGKNFTGSTRVYIGSGSTVSDFLVKSDSTLEVTVFENATSGNLRIQSPGGLGNYSIDRYAVSDPYIALSPSSLSFVDVPVGNSEVKTYQVSGIGLANEVPVTINVTNLSNVFTISTQPSSGFGKSLELSGVSNNRLDPTTIYVKYTPVGIESNNGLISNAQGSISKEMALSATSTASSVPMPVELVSFNVKSKNNTAYLEWSTASEKNNSHFEVEVSKGALDNFTLIGLVETKSSNSSVFQHYNFSYPLANNKTTLYFRLKQVDWDGGFEYSKLVALETSVISGKQDITVAPNPVTENSKIYITSSSQITGYISINTLTGRQIFKKDISLLNVYNEIELPIFNSLQRGVYILTVENENKVQQIKVFKK